ncbi:Isoleucine--tRNA ligase [Buchnera aphidicola (Sipha maydis)]|uniref:isoleucine--tRNA ligase n=1 Tax=Buchnera aphidicola TaxID=9 RepID=UPI0034642ADA
MTNYKNTLNLPKTNFSMRGNLPHKELQILKEWKKNNLYKIILHSKKNKKTFIVQDGPPYANGKIHIGHALNKILKDIIIKFQNLSGYQVPFIPCWDCHGLPIEHKIEKKYSKKFKKLTKRNIRKKCKKYALKQVKFQKEDFIRLGVLADWKNSELTMNYKNQANIIKQIQKINKKKFLYQGKKPIHWCIECQSSLAEAEIEYQKKKSHSIYFSFQASNNDVIINKFNIKTQKNIQIYILVWTTTPWTLPASQAISINPNFLYNLIKIKEKYFILSKNRTNEILKILKKKKIKILGSIYGNQLEKILFQHPFLKLKLPIILSKHVTSDIGTGCVHTAPAHGEEDYKSCQKYKIFPKNIIDSFGKYKKNIHSQLNNKNIFQANSIIINLLKNKKSLLKEDIIKHSYPYCWRHKSIVIFRSTKQWFIKIKKKKFKEKIVKIIKNISWIPNWTKKNMISLIKKRPDWCISRQRNWGVPLPFFTHKKTGKLHKKTNSLIKKISIMIEKNGIEAWWKLDKEKLLGKDSKLYKKSHDIVDVWFESGCMNANLIYPKKNKYRKADLYIEGSDQHRGWFMSSLILSIIIKQKEPYKKVITHGFTIDKNGKKMSKSLGNTINPEEIINKYGADILRLWVASSNYSKDISISHEIINHIIDSYRKIRNTARFLLGNIYDFHPKKDFLKKDNLLKIDLWAIEKTFITQKKIIKLYQEYKFHKVIKCILHFCFIDMSSIYFDIIKDRLYTSHKDSCNRKSCQTAIYLIIHALTIWISPLIPFTSYEIWKNIPANKNFHKLFTTKWFNKLFLVSKTEKLNKTQWNKIFLIKHAINKLIEKKKKEKIIQSSLQLSIILYLKKNLFKEITTLKNDLKFIFLTSECLLKKYSDAPKNLKKNKKIPDIKIDLKIFSGKKCKRCWNYYHFNKYKKNNILNVCDRCYKNILGKETTRIFA